MQEERYRTRDRTYSAWHRRLSTRRFIGIEYAQLLAMIDLDASLYIEYDDHTREPLALIETAKDIGQEYKTAIVTQKLAIRAQLPAYVVLYTPSALSNPADAAYRDIKSFRVKRLNPRPDKSWIIYTPQEWCANLLKLRKFSADLLDQEITQAEGFNHDHH
jgi:hypothetical protein